MAEPGLQKLPPRHGDPAKSIFETADPDVPTTSQPLPSSRPSAKKKVMSVVSNKDGKDVFKIINYQSKVKMYFGDGQITKISDSTSSNESELSSEEARKDQTASSSDESKGGQCSSQCPANTPAEEENEATHQHTVHTNYRNEENEHINHGFTDNGSFHSFPGDSLGSAEEENEATHQHTVHTNYQNEEKEHINHGFTDNESFHSFPGDSLGSINTTSSTTTKVFMTRTGIHVPKNKNTESVIQATNETNMLDNDDDMRSIADSELFENPKRNSLYSTENVTEATNGTNMPTNNANRSYIADNRLFQYIDSLIRGCLNLKGPLRKWMTLGIFGLCIIVVAIWIFHNNYFLVSDNANDPASSIQSPHIPGQCENEISTALIGEQICISYTSTQKFTSSTSSIHVRQLTSQYFNALEVFDVNVSSDNFVQKHGDWTVNFNSSRTDKQFRFFKETATCDNIGIYEITIEYDDGNITSVEFEIGLKDPKLQHSVTRINDSIHVHCEMTNTCKASSLALFVNNGESSRLIPTMNECGNNDKKNSSTISTSAIIPVSRFSGNQTISCVPLMTDPELAANLTSTMGIPVCEGADCIPNCKDDPYGIAYFQDKHICNIFYQCSNGDIILQNCPSSTYWSHSECTCVHFDDEICDGKTYRFFQPAISFEKCTKA